MAAVKASPLLCTAGVQANKGLFLCFSWGDVADKECFFFPLPSGESRLPTHQNDCMWSRPGFSALDSDIVRLRRFREAPNEIKHAHSTELRFLQIVMAQNYQDSWFDDKWQVHCRVAITNTICTQQRHDGGEWVMESIVTMTHKDVVVSSIPY